MNAGSINDETAKGHMANILAQYSGLDHTHIDLFVLTHTLFPVAWHDEYDKPLGVPKKDAQLIGDLYWREFTNSIGITTVTFNITSNIGKIYWAGESPAPPKPNPPAPNPCLASAFLNETGIADGDITPGLLA